VHHTRAPAVGVALQRSPRRDSHRIPPHSRSHKSPEYPRRGDPGGAGGDTVVAFRDTLTSAREYLIVSDANALTVPHAASGSFRASASLPRRRLRHHHAQPLPRRSRPACCASNFHNGVRTAVVDVQSIYDEFNYGHISSESIKAFLLYGYNNWPHRP